MGSKKRLSKFLCAISHSPPVSWRWASRSREVGKAKFHPFSRGIYRSRWILLGDVVKEYVVAFFCFFLFYFSPSVTDLFEHVFDVDEFDWSSLTRARASRSGIIVSLEGMVEVCGLALAGHWRRTGEFWIHVEYRILTILRSCWHWLYFLPPEENSTYLALFTSRILYAVVSGRSNTVWIVGI